MAKRGMGRLLGVVVGLLALVGIAASATHYLYEPYNPGSSTTRPSWRCT
jgi:hypothetical protein